MVEPVRIILPELYQKQHDAFFGSERISCIEASTKAGKSVGGLTWLSHHAVNIAGGCAHLWLSPVYPQAKVMFTRLVRWLSEMDPRHETGWDTNRTDLFVAMPGGSPIWCKGADNPDSIYGSDYAAVVIDEASRCREEAWHAVRSTTTATRAPIRAIGNVKGRKNWFYRLCRRAQAGEPGMAYHKITAQDAVDAGVLDAEEIEEARRHLPEPVFRELYFAEAADDAGNPFGYDAIRSCIAPMSTGDPVAWGWDLAKSVDWTVGIALDGAGRVCRFIHVQEPWRETKHLILDESGHTTGLVDSTGVGDPIVEEIQRAGSPRLEGYRFTSHSKQQIMEGLRSAIHRQEIRFPDGPISNELEAFEYEYTRTGVKYSAPEGMHDDCVCALALAWHAFAGAAPSWESADQLLVGTPTVHPRW